MTPIPVLLALCNIICGVVFIGISIPLIGRRIGPNRWYGFRLRKAFRSEALWYEINAYGGRQMLIWAIPMIIAGIICLFLQFDRTSSEVVLLLWGAGPVIVFSTIPLVMTLIYASRR